MERPQFVPETKNSPTIVQALARRVICFSPRLSLTAVALGSLGIAQMLDGGSEVLAAGPDCLAHVKINGFRGQVLHIHDAQGRLLESIAVESDSPNGQPTVRLLTSECDADFGSSLRLVLTSPQYPQYKEQEKVPNGLNLEVNLKGLRGLPTLVASPNPYIVATAKPENTSAPINTQTPEPTKPTVTPAKPTKTPVPAPIPVYDLDKPPCSADVDEKVLGRIYKFATDLDAKVLDLIFSNGPGCDLGVEAVTGRSFTPPVTNRNIVNIPSFFLVTVGGLGLFFRGLTLAWRGRVVAANTAVNGLRRLWTWIRH